MIKSSKDTRYAVDSVVTHDGVKFPCWVLSDLSSCKLKLGQDTYDKVIFFFFFKFWFPFNFPFRDSPVRRFDR